VQVRAGPDVAAGLRGEQDTAGQGDESLLYRVGGVEDGDRGVGVAGVGVPPLILRA
jgi:hypothetical protein